MMKIRLKKIRIEPDWNVKCSVSGFINDLVNIRIEPDWNVKPS